MMTGRPGPASAEEALSEPEEKVSEGRPEAPGVATGDGDDRVSPRESETESASRDDSPGWMFVVFSQSAIFRNHSLILL
jgi:hypothetical protein